MSTIKDAIWKTTTDYIRKLEESGITFPNSPYTVSNWLQLITDLQKKVLSLQKMFSFPKFQDINSFVKYGASFHENLTLRALHEERKIEISYENESSFNLNSQGLFFPVERYSDHLRVKILEIYENPEKSWDGNIYGFTDKGNWLFIKIHIETVSANRYNSIFSYHKNREKRPSVFRKISLHVKEVSLADIISDLSLDYWQSGKEDRSRCEIKNSIKVATLIWDQIINYVLRVFERTEERRNLLENLLREISIKDALIRLLGRYEL